jgi:hypothetical protein
LAFAEGNELRVLDATRGYLLPDRNVPAAIHQGSNERAQLYLREYLALQRTYRAETDPEVMSTMMGLAVSLTQSRKFAEAEPLLRQIVALHPNEVDAWERFNTLSLLGAVLAGQQQKMDEAEAKLLSGYEGMKQREATMPVPERKHISEAARRLVKFYEDTGKPDLAESWRAKMSAPTTSPTTSHQ